MQLELCGGKQADPSLGETQSALALIEMSKQMGHNNHGLIPPRRRGRADKEEQVKERASTKKGKETQAMEREKRSQKRASPSKRQSPGRKKKAKKNSPSKDKHDEDLEKEAELQASPRQTTKDNANEMNPDGGDTEPEYNEDGASTPPKGKAVDEGMKII